MDKGTKGLLYGLLGLVLIGGSVGVALYFDSQEDEDKGKSEEQKAKEAKEAKEALADLGVDVDPSVKSHLDDEEEEAVQEELNTTAPEDGGIEESFITAGDTIYPFNDYVNVRSSPEVNNGIWNNLKFKIFSPDPVGVVRSSVIVGDHVWYDVAVPFGNHGDIASEAFDSLGWLDNYVRADMVTKI